jgi:hypothetical protein
MTSPSCLSEYIESIVHAYVEHKCWHEFVDSDYEDEDGIAILGE